jgi:LPXTG-motif cell wall-anchored protein
MDEVALNVLLMETDVPTAVAGSLTQDGINAAPQTGEKRRNGGFALGLLLGIVAGVVWLLFH